MQRQKQLNRALIFLAAAILILGAALALTVPAELKDLARAHAERMFSDGRPGFGHGRFLPVAGTVLLLLVIGGIVLRRYDPPRGRTNDRNAVEILREKYAAGEISREDYAARKRILENDSELE